MLYHLTIDHKGVHFLPGSVQIHLEGVQITVGGVHFQLKGCARENIVVLYGVALFP